MVSPKKLSEEIRVSDSEEREGEVGGSPLHPPQRESDSEEEKKSPDDLVRITHSSLEDNI